MRVKGHTLPHEGKRYSPTAYYGWTDGEGCTRCSCGEESPILPSTSARKQWHREHKLAVTGGMQ